MNFDNWYAATMLLKKQQAAEPRSERVTAGEACWSRAPARIREGGLVGFWQGWGGGGWGDGGGGGGGRGVFIILEQLQFRIQTCRRNSQHSPPLQLRH